MNGAYGKKVLGVGPRTQRVRRTWNKTARVDNGDVGEVGCGWVRTGLWRFGRCGDVYVAVACARFAFLGLFGTAREFFNFFSFFRTGCEKHFVAGL